MEFFNHFLFVILPMVNPEQISLFRKTIIIVFAVLATSLIIRAVIKEIISVYSDIIKSRESQKWPRTKGVITRSEVDIHIAPDDVTYFNDLRYKYFINNKKYVSDKFSFLKSTEGFGFRNSCEAFKEKYSVGLNLNVFYNPNNPSEAVLSTKNDFLTIIGRFFDACLSVLFFSFFILITFLIALSVACFSSTWVVMLCLIALFTTIILGFFYLKIM